MNVIILHNLERIVKRNASKTISLKKKKTTSDSFRDLLYAKFWQIVYIYIMKKKMLPERF